MKSNNYRILVIDDVASIHDDFRKILAPQKEKSHQCLDEINATLLGQSTPQANHLPPFKIDSALQSQEGLNLIKKAVMNSEPYAVAFVDVQMPPGEDGVETIKKMWQIDQEIQAVICTAYSKYSWEDLLKRFGETDRLFIIKKPFDNVEILQLATSLVKKWNLHRVINDELTNLRKLALPPQQKTQAEASINSMKEAIDSLAAINTKFKRSN